MVIAPTVAPESGGSGAPTGMFLITGSGLTVTLLNVCHRVRVHKHPYIEMRLDFSLRLSLGRRIRPFHVESVTPPLHAEARAFEVPN
jgi:hypothetical protein